MTSDLITPILSSVITSLVVGMVLAVFNFKLRQSAKEATEANLFKTKVIEQKIESVRDLAKETKMIVASLQEKVASLDKRVEITNNNMGHVTNRLIELTGGIEKMAVEFQKNFGKVIRKP